MEFLNETSLATYLARSQLFYQDLLQAIVAVKGTFDVLPSGETRLASVQSPLLLEDEETPFGTLEGEIVPAKAWCDLALLGHARSPSPRRPVTRMQVSLRIGTFSRVVQVTGDRAWVPALGRLRPSEPQPFSQLPLSNQRAFGGAARQNADLETGYFANPDGRGYVALAQDAAGVLLPNIEELDQPVRSWKDRPLPAGLAPLARSSILRAQRGVIVDTAKQITRIDASAFCFSHPRMCLPSYPDGAPVELGGVSSGRPWRFRLPAFRYGLRVDLGEACYHLPLVPDTLYLRPDDSQIAVVARSAFIYQFLPERLRSARVVAQAPPAGREQATNRPGPPTPTTLTTTIRQVRAAAAPTVPLVVPQSTALSLPLESLMAAHPLIDLIDTLPLCPSG